MRRQILILLVLMLAGVANAQQVVTRELLHADPSEPVELKVDSGPASKTTAITWDAREPMSLKGKCYEGNVVFVFVGSPGGRYTVQSQVTHWDGQALQVERINWIITVAGAAPPAPVPPGPAPGPSPPGPAPLPPTPVPDTVPNDYGVGAKAYALARSLGDPASAKVLASAFNNGSLAVHSGNLPASAEQIVSQAAGQLPASWRAVHEQLGALVKDARKQHGNGALVFKGIYREIAIALTESAK